MIQLRYRRRCGHPAFLEVHKNDAKSANTQHRILRLEKRDCIDCLYYPPYVDYRERTYFEDSRCIGETAKSLHCDIRISKTQRTKGWVAKSHLSTLSELQKPGDYGALVISYWLAVTMKLIPNGYMG